MAGRECRCTSLLRRAGNHAWVPRFVPRSQSHCIFVCVCVMCWAVLGRMRISAMEAVHNRVMLSPCLCMVRYALDLGRISVAWGVLALCGVLRVLRVRLVPPRCEAVAWGVADVLGWLGLPSSSMSNVQDRRSTERMKPEPFSKGAQVISPQGASCRLQSIRGWARATNPFVSGSQTQHRAPNYPGLVCRRAPQIAPQGAAG